MVNKKIYPETVMRIALKEVGTVERPHNSNNVKYNTWFYGHAVSGSSYPWCGAYVNWVFDQAGARHLFNDGNKTAGTQTVQAWGNRHKDQIVAKNAGRYADIVLFHFGANHVHHIGFIIKKNADGSYQTVEGNTSKSSNDNGGKVMIRTRYQSDIAMIIRPKYDMHPAVAVKAGCRVRKDMHPKAKTIHKYDQGEKLRWVKDMKNGWSKVIFLSDGEVGYVKNAYLKKVALTGYPKKKIKVRAALRKNNSSRSKKLQKALLKPGTMVKVVAVRKYWTNVIYNGQSGYVATKKIAL